MGRTLCMMCILLTWGCSPEGGGQDLEEQTLVERVTDSDRDGIPVGEDCNDEDSAVFPGAEEACNGMDDDCDGSADNGFACVQSLAGVPCPTACGSTGTGMCDATCVVASCTPPDEVCNGVDDNCDGYTDEGCATYYADSDGDGYGNEAVSMWAVSQPSGYVNNSSDCDDNNDMVSPGYPEICDDGLDNDCNGEIDDGQSCG